MQHTILIMLTGLALAACGSGDQPLSEIRDDTVRALDSRITATSITPAASGLLNVEIILKNQPLVGGGQAWNSLASTSDHLLKATYPSGKINRLSVVAIAPDNGNLDWARVEYSRQDLGAQWMELTYLQRFATSKAKPGTQEAAAWLCEFYGSYESARPANAQCD